MEDLLSALSTLKENLQCGYCNKLPSNGAILLKCSHIYCKSHITGGQLKSCFICHEGNVEDFFPASVESEMIKDYEGLGNILMKFHKDRDNATKVESKLPVSEKKFEKIPSTATSRNKCKPEEPCLPKPADSNIRPGRVLRRKLKNEIEGETIFTNMSPSKDKNGCSKSLKQDKVSKRPLRKTSRSPLNKNESFERSVSKSKTSSSSNLLPAVQSCDESLSDAVNINEKMLWKRNKKGETALHSACVKGQEELALALLAAGADPNTRDHAGWTPLHEAAGAGRAALVRALLAHGALPAPPGPRYATPLHEALRASRSRVAELLLRAGADPRARDDRGLTPADLADRSLLERLEELQASEKSPVREYKIKMSLNVSVYPSGLTKEHMSKLTMLCKSHKDLTLVKNLTADGTYLLVEENRVNRDTLLAVASGRGILTTAWLDSCDSAELAAFETFEVNSLGNDVECVKLSVNNLKALKPGLFDGYNFFFLGFASLYEISAHLKVKKGYLTSLVEAAGGTALSREPKPENIREKCIPYHAPRGGPLEECTHVIIYETRPQLAYNMRHVKSLPVGWLVDCLLNFRLVDP